MSMIKERLSEKLSDKLISEPPNASSTVEGMKTQCPQTKSETKSEEGEAVASNETRKYPSGFKLTLILVSVLGSMFLTALDRMIVATAIPKITDDFHSLQDAGWYGSAYMLTECSFQLMTGKLYTILPVRTVYLSSILLFEIGSAVCGAAPSSTVFIVGRAIQGVGSAGIFSGAIVSIVYAIPLHKRPLFQGLFGAVFGIASVLGPLIGGAFTTKVSWRWCFYINIPIGVLAMVVIFFLLDVPNNNLPARLPWKTKLAQLDAAGTAALIPGVVCLLLALQWGGVTYPWNDRHIIPLLIVGGLLFIVFVVIQFVLPTTATVPPYLFQNRSIVSGMLSATFYGGAMTIFIYYIPIWFQAIKNVSAIDSGIRIIPITLAMVLGALSSGIVTSKIGYYTPCLIVGTCISSVGAGLLTLLSGSTAAGKWIGYEIIYGFGLGFSFQAPNMAAQTVLEEKDVPVGASLMFFSQLLSGSIFVSVGQNVLDNQLIHRLGKVSGFDTSQVQDAGATTLVNSAPAELRELVLTIYNLSLRQVFIIGLILTCLSVLSALLMEWKSVKNKSSILVDDEKGQSSVGSSLN